MFQQNQLEKIKHQKIQHDTVKSSKKNRNIKALQFFFAILTKPLAVIKITLGILLFKFGFTIDKISIFQSRTNLVIIEN